MFDRITHPAKRMLTRARVECLRRRNEEIDDAHLLLALASVPEGTAASVLRRMNLGFEALWREVGRLSPDGTAPLTRDSIPFSKRAKRVLELALTEARTLGDFHVDTGYLLLAILLEEAGPAAQALRALGVEVEDLRRNVAECRARKDSPEAQAPSHASDLLWRRQRLEGLLREEDLPALSAASGVPVATLSEWRDGLVAAIEASFRGTLGTLGS